MTNSIIFLQQRLSVMNKEERKSHWETIYETKALTDVSWYQPIPQTSLDFIDKTGVSKNAKIIDIGGGDSFLVDHLLDLGYKNLSVLDISHAAIERAKKRLGKKAEIVNWIVSDITLFETTEQFDVWHDRAAFHFLRSEEDIESYVQHVKNYTHENSHLIVGTFAKDGPLKCSGIEITQYSGESLRSIFSLGWDQKENQKVIHPTPFNTEQAFVFSHFSKKY